MVNGKVIAIDARMIEMSGIGTYIQHLMGKGIYDYAVGNPDIIRKYDKNVRIIPFNAPIYKVKEQLCFPVKEIDNAEIDIMHFPHYNVPLVYRGRYVVTVHDLTHIVLPEFLGSRLKYLYAERLMKRALNNADHVFTVSENSKEDIINYFGIESNKISITYNAIDADFTKEARSKIDYLYSKYNIPRNKNKILYVGNIKPHKNLQTLLSAFARMKEDNVLILVGKAFNSVSLVDLENKVGGGTADRVIYTGQVNKKELIDLYNLADVFAFPSLYEGFGIPPLEAMACGTPVVAANNSSIPEVVGDAALLVNGRDEKAFADALEKVLSNKDVSNELITRGFERCNHFFWDDTVKEVKRQLSVL